MTDRENPVTLKPDHENQKENPMLRRLKHLFCRALIKAGFAALCSFAAAMMISGSCAEPESSEFTVQRIGQMICYGKNAFSVQAPEDGEFSVKISDDVCVYRILRQHVKKGINEISWDGCGYNEERLDTKYYNFDFRLESGNGKIYTFFFRSPVVENAQHLQFVLPSGPAAYLSDPESWFIEIKAVRNGTINVELFRENAEQIAEYVYSRTVHLGRVEHFSLDKIAGRRLPEPGAYHVNVYEISRPDEIVSFSLQIHSGVPEKPDVTATGEIMPSQDADDNEIWNAMMRPSVVVDIDPQKHQNIFEEPDQKSVSLGTLHGQTQCLAVFETREDWAKIGAWNHEDAEYVEGWIPLNRLKVVEPNREFGLLVDKKKQTITVFRNGERIETLLVSTGRMDPGKFDRETSAGCYLSGLHRVDFSTQGLKYDFVIQYDGGNLLHQIPYSSDGRKDFTQGKAYLGAKASHACIRIQDEPGPEAGVNAYWIWTHIPYHTKIIILDDPEERRGEKARLSGETPMAVNPAFFDSCRETGNTIVLTFAGDVIPGSTEETFGNAAGFGTVFSQAGRNNHFLEGVSDFFGTDDFTCLSLACVLQADRSGEDPYRTSKYRGLPEYAAIFSRGSVDLVSLGDDHLLDYQQSGYDATVKAVETAVPWVGRNHSQVIEIRDHLFGFTTISQQEYLKDPKIIGSEIQKLKDSGCEYIIVQCHWGNEKDTLHSKLQEAMARACAREGADLVIGRHPAGVQGVASIGGMPVIYSLGRLISDISVRTGTFDSLAVQAVFDPDHPERYPAIRLIPLLSSSSAAPENNYKPVLADEMSADRILKQIQLDSWFEIVKNGDE